MLDKIKMNKKIFIGYWFYMVGSIIAFIMSFLVIAFFIARTIIAPQEAIVKMCVYTFITIITGVTLMALMGYYMMQFVVVTEEEIKVRCLWCTVRKLRWEEIKEVRCERYYVSGKGAFSFNWYVFDDGVKRQEKSGVVKKNTHITLVASKRAKKAIEEFWKGEIKDKTIT